MILRRPCQLWYVARGLESPSPVILASVDEGEDMIEVNWRSQTCKVCYEDSGYVWLRHPEWIAIVAIPWTWVLLEERRG